MSWLRRKIKKYLEIYEPEDLQVGGHCGLCGSWIPNQIFPIEWSWGICAACYADPGDDPDITLE